VLCNALEHVVSCDSPWTLNTSAWRTLNVGSNNAYANQLMCTIDQNDQFTKSQKEKTPLKQLGSWVLWCIAHSAMCLKFSIINKLNLIIDYKSCEWKIMHLKLQFVTLWLTSYNSFTSLYLSEQSNSTFVAPNLWLLVAILAYTFTSFKNNNM
jgi:hypothetical protein